jgi:hypothetical protein
MRSHTVRPTLAAVSSVLLVLTVAAAPIVAKGPTPGHGKPTPTPASSEVAPPTVQPPVTPAAVQVYGAWHCSDDYCTWAAARDTSPGGDFDTANHWLIDRDAGPASGLPSVNVVVLSFVNPLTLLHGSSQADPLGGVPVGMTSDVVQYFTSHGIRVMVSIGGITYVNDWNAALAEDAAGLGQRAAWLASELGVGVEIDYEENRSPDLDGVQAFIDAYRAIHPYDPTGYDPAARLTIDLAAGDRWLIALTERATREWLRTDTPVLDYANAMVPSRQPSVDKAIANWQEHLDGKPQYDPPILPLAPAKFTGSVYVAEGSQVRPECNDFASSLQSGTASFVTTAVGADAGWSIGMLGWMFWAAEKPSTRGVGTVPPNTCEGGVGVGASTFDIPIPMPALRQE